MAAVKISKHNWILYMTPYSLAEGTTFYSTDVGSVFFRKVAIHLQDYTVSQPEAHNMNFNTDCSGNYHCSVESVAPLSTFPWTRCNWRGAGVTFFNQREIWHVMNIYWFFFSQNKFPFTKFLANLLWKNELSGYLKMPNASEMVSLISLPYHASG
jgi:hypothetical protein